MKEAPNRLTGIEWLIFMAIVVIAVLCFVGK